MISYLLPTHNRPERLCATLNALGQLSAAKHEAIEGAEVIVVDNASSPPIHLPDRLENGFAVRVIKLSRNHGAAARNVGVHEARGEWIVMLDDDSYPLNDQHIDVVLHADADVAAIGAEIMLPDGLREAGGLPEVIIGCGTVLRRKAFLSVGGYDPAFDYYVEEYDLCARLLRSGWRIVHDCRFQVHHAKSAAGRDMNRIVHRLVRNNGWVIQRYAPQAYRTRELHQTIERYARIAVKEQAAHGFADGVAELLQTLQHQPAETLQQELYDRFTGLAHVRAELAQHAEWLGGGVRVAIVNEGKNAWAVRQVLDELGAQIVVEREADALVIGTLSPGPMLDAWTQQRQRRCGDDRPVLLPWQPVRWRQAVHHADFACA